MSIPNEALQKVSLLASSMQGQHCLHPFQLALEIESQANSAQRDINLVKAAIATKQRDARMLELTSSEVKALDKNTKVYEGVGKMYANRSPQPCFAFCTSADNWRIGLCLAHQRKLRKRFQPTWQS